MKEKRFSLKEFADYMDMSYRNAQDFVKRDVINTTQLRKASEFLDEDLTVYFKPNISISSAVNSNVSDNIEISDELKMCLFLKGNLKDIPRFKDMLKEMNGVSEKYGFSVMT